MGQTGVSGRIKTVTGLLFDILLIITLAIPALIGACVLFDILLIITLAIPALIGACVLLFVSQESTWHDGVEPWDSQKK